MRGRSTVRSRGCTRPANWKKPGLRPQKCIGTIVAPVLRASEAIIGFHGGSRTRRLLRSTLETSPDGNTPRMCPSLRWRMLSWMGLMFCRSAFWPPKGFTKMNMPRISGIASRK